MAGCAICGRYFFLLKVGVFQRGLLKKFTGFGPLFYCFFFFFFFFLHWLQWSSQQDRGEILVFCR